MRKHAEKFSFFFARLGGRRDVLSGYADPILQMTWAMFYYGKNIIEDGSHAGFLVFRFENSIIFVNLRVTLATRTERKIQ